MPPRELPGFYWDETKERYFPLSSRPPGSPTTLPSNASLSSDISGQQRTRYRNEGPLKRRKVEFQQEPQPQNVWSLVDRMRTGGTYTATGRYVHELELQSIARPCRVEVNSVSDSNVLSFVATEQADGSYTTTVGDQLGWVYTQYSAVPNVPTREVFLGSQVNTVCCTQDIRVAIPFGAACEVVIQNLTSPDVSMWTILRILDKSCHDVRDAHLLDHSLLLGAAGRGILMPDIVASTHFRFLPTKSDVLSVYQLGQLCYTGCRNGSIQCFDRRVETVHKGQELFNQRFKGTNSSITHLSVVNEWQLLVSTIGGSLEMYDLRFAGNPGPIMQFQGHSNRYTEKLGLAVSPAHDLLFAASDERRVNAWSLRTGNPIIPSVDPKQSPDSSLLALVPLPKRCPRLLEEPFPAEIPAMQVTDGGSGEDRGLCVWVASGKALYRYRIGKRPLF
ncbi:unnamed protein product [Somion occarium]|uniref:Uncharacterized protein n=1 Tax=Somion occarium TaxID=3059160 RepID=A0ABP1DYW9_9APHY